MRITRIQNHIDLLIISTIFSISFEFIPFCFEPFFGFRTKNIIFRRVEFSVFVQNINFVIHPLHEKEMENEMIKALHMIAFESIHFIFHSVFFAVAGNLMKCVCVFLSHRLKFKSDFSRNFFNKCEINKEKE